MEKQFKYIYKGNEVSKEEFTNVAKEMFKWFDNNTINAVDYSSVSDFLDGDYKSKGEINNHLKGILDGLDSSIWNKDKEGNKLVEKLGWQYRRGNVSKCNTAKDTDKIGEKHNKHKLPMSKLFLQFPDALQAVVLASCYGHHCYPLDTDWLNFKRVEGGSQNYKDAEIRHFLGGEKDKESNLPEIFHQAWNKLAELQLWLEENKVNIKDFSKDYLKNLQNQK